MLFSLVTNFKYAAEQLMFVVKFSFGGNIYFVLEIFCFLKRNVLLQVNII